MKDGPVEHLAELLGHRLGEDNRRLFDDGLQKTGLALGHPRGTPPPGARWPGTRWPTGR